VRLSWEDNHALLCKERPFVLWGIGATTAAIRLITPHLPLCRQNFLMLAVDRGSQRKRCSRTIITCGPQSSAMSLDDEAAADQQISWSIIDRARGVRRVP